MKLKQIRKTIIQTLLSHYRQTASQLSLIEMALANQGIQTIYFDHFAMIDLPGPHSGIPILKKLFLLLGYIEQGQGYLPEKQNDFIWMSEIDHPDQLAKDVLPQAVAADFRLIEMPVEIADIIEKYARHATPPPFAQIERLIQQCNQDGDDSTSQQLINLVCTYLTQRDWPLPSLAEFLQVWEFNQLLAWVLAFGRKPNHFTLSIHLLSKFSDLAHFHSFIEQTLGLPFNLEGGLIKGGETVGIAQSSTMGALQTINLADGKIDLPTGFVEFVWRFPKPNKTSSVLWQDFFTGFIAKQATHVIRSLAHQAR